MYSDKWMGEDDELLPRREPDDLVRRVAKARIADKLFASGEQIRIGRYQLLEKVGEGGMSVVWGALDPELDRRVAIKLVKAKDGTARERMLAEGQALAKLSHPNVVPVFDVGVVDDRVYLVMEWVRGKNLREWCDDQPRSDREILDVYRAAASGLVAAHRAGLVHRDFKPDNAVIGDDGRVRVLDFGLASSESAAPDPDVIVVRVAGTPRYMAPEQTSGGEITAAVDQYTFGASLREAMGPNMPPWVGAIVARAMASSPSERFPSMAAVVEALGRDPRVVWRRRLLAGAVVALAGGAFVIGTLRSEKADSCAGGEAEIATTWSPAHADRVRSAAKTDGPAAVLVFDAWAKRWTSNRRAVCEAGRGSWSTRLFDRGLSCLATRRQRFASMIEVFESPRHGRGVELLQHGLPDPEPCADPAYLEAAVAPPSEPVKAAVVHAVQAHLVAAHVVAQTGDASRAREWVDVLAQQSASLGYAPLVSQARLTSGAIALTASAWQRALEDLREAYFGARAASDPETAARAASYLTLLLLNMSQDREANQWARLAVAEATTSNDPAIESYAARAQAVLAHDTGDVANVVAYADRYVAVEKRRGVGMAVALMERGKALHIVGKHDEALVAFDTARADATSSQLTTLRSMIETERSLVLVELGRHDDAVVAAREALAILDEMVAPDGATTLGALGALGVALGRTSQFAESLDVFDRSLAIERATEGPRSYNVASDLNNRADVLARLERYDEAFANWDEARSIFAEIDGHESQDIARLELGYVMALLRAGQGARMAPHAEVAVAVFAKTPEHMGYAMAQIALGLARVEQRDWKHATELLERGLAAISDGPWRAEAELGLATALAATGDPVRARALVASALPRLESGNGTTRRIAEAKALQTRLR
ncbi:MAG: protein kinase domain-containing protein [Kofleriaceae bacterium]